MIKIPNLTIVCLTLLALASCAKMEDSVAKVKAPLRNYIITSRLDNKQAGTVSQATGILKGTYSETTKLLTYTLTFEIDDPVSIRIDKGPRGVKGTTVMEIEKNVNQSYRSPIAGEKKITSLEERDMLKGLWFVSIESVNYRPYEIRGQVTIKQK